MVKPKGIGTCAKCACWDIKTPNFNEILGAGEKAKSFACRRDPTVVFKTAEEWCLSFLDAKR